MRTWLFTNHHPSSIILLRHYAPVYWLNTPTGLSHSNTKCHLLIQNVAAWSAVMGPKIGKVLYRPEVCSSYCLLISPNAPELLPFSIS